RHRQIMSDVTRTVFLDSGEQKLELQRYKLSIVDGANAGDVSTWEGRRITLGSSPDNDVVLDDPTISRVHATIEVDETGYILRDNDSKNGTFASGLRVREVYLTSGTTLRLGDTTLRFETTGVEVEVRFSGREKFGNLLGKSLVMREVFSML